MQRFLTIMTTGLLVMALSSGAAWAKTDIAQSEGVQTKAKAIEAYENQHQAALAGKFTVKVNFKDITDHWASVPIKRVAGMWLCTGYGDGTFRPNSNLSQAEMIALIMRLVDDSSVSAATYSAELKEVPGWARVSVHKAVYLNVISPEQFQPTQQATRAQTCVALAKAFKLAPLENADVNFADRALIDQDDLKYIAAMYQAGYIKGGQGNYFLPESSITRAEMANIMDRILDDLRKFSSQGAIVTQPNQANDLPGGDGKAEVVPDI